MPNFASTSPRSIEPSQANTRELEISRLDKKKEYQYTLSNTLQNSLDVSATLEHFYTLIQKTISCTGMSYQLHQKALEYTFGKIRAHKAKYALNISTGFLGDLTFFNAKPLTETELKTTESLIGVLIPPLRNSLLYLEAIEKSMQDPLTKIGNRLAMDMAFKREISLSHRSSQPLSLLMIDIDFFKRVNDNEGHQTGDKLLVNIAQTIKDTLRETDQVFRFGGEEFAVLLSNTEHGDALIIAERMRLAVEKTRAIGPLGSVKATISIGVTTSTQYDSQEQLIEKADCALYTAKANGRNRIESCKLTEQSVSHEVQRA